MHPWNQPFELDYNRRIFDEELDEFLPEKIFDAHVHLAGPGCIPEEKPFSCGGVPVTNYTYENLACDLAMAFPGRETAALCFGFPDPAYDTVASNRYVGNGADFRRFFPLRLLDPLRDTAESVSADLDRFGFLGLKPYPDYARPGDIPNAEIPEMLPDWAMELAHERQLLVVLHIPRPSRLEDPLNRRHIGELCSRWPRAKIILAHAGRAYYLRGIIGLLEELRHLPNLYFDVAMMQHWEVLAYLFREIATDQLLFGSDIPIGLAQGKAVEINHQYSYVTPRPWSIALCDDRGRMRFTSFLNEELRAIRQASEAARLSRSAIAALFHDNARALVDGVPSRKFNLNPVSKT
jgi:hypothetical protein